MKFGLRYASLGRYSNGAAAVELAQAAEAAGFDSIWTVEHVVVPRGYQSRYPYSPTGRMGSGLEDYPIPDPLIWLAYVASATRAIKLGTAILILPQRNPVVTAKAVATLDHLAGGGRVLLGIGVGWLAEEFATLGVPFEDRGPRTDEYVAAMRALWSQECASYRGRFVSFDQGSAAPCLPGAAFPSSWAATLRPRPGAPAALATATFPRGARPPSSSTRCAAPPSLRVATRRRSRSLRLRRRSQPRSRRWPGKVWRAWRCPSALPRGCRRRSRRPTMCSVTARM